MRQSGCAAVVLAAGLALASSSAPAAAFDPYIVKDLDISIEADSAVEAKDEALSRAAAEGLELVLRRITRQADRARLPAPAANIAEPLLDRLAIVSERVGTITYSGRFRADFSRPAIRALLSRHGVPAIDQAAPEILIIPVIETSGQSLWWADAAPWADALAATRFEDGLTPARLPTNSRSDLAADRDGAMTGDPATLGDFRLRYGTHAALVAVVRFDPDDAPFALRLVGEDAAGFIDKEEAIGSADLAAAARRVADMLSGRWKAVLAGDRVSARPPIAPSGAGPAAATARTETAAAGSPGSHLDVRVLLHGGDREWRDIQRRLAASRAVTVVAARPAGPRAVELTLRHDGDPRRLADALAAHGLDLFEAGGRWLLQSY